MKVLFSKLISIKFAHVTQILIITAKQNTKLTVKCMQGCQDMPLTIARYSTTQKKVNTVMRYANSIAFTGFRISHDLNDH